MVTDPCLDPHAVCDESSATCRCAKGIIVNELDYSCSEWGDRGRRNSDIFLQRT